MENMLRNIPEEWRSIAEFPIYEISNLGRVVNVQSDFLIKPTKTLQGDLKVGLCPSVMGDNQILIGGPQKTRMLKLLVARTFVPGEDEEFNTPILLDGDPEHVWAHNIMWRPRPFAWRYSNQFSRPIPETFYLGPFVEVTPQGGIVRAYDNVVDIGVTNGLVFADVWAAIHTRTMVYPTHQFFAFHDKV